MRDRNVRRRCCHQRMEDNNTHEDNQLNLDEIARAVIANSIWAVPGVEEQPHLQTLCWTVRELPNGHRHICAWLGYEGRVSSGICEWLPEQRVLVTNSGRRYKIDSPIGSQSDAEYVWTHWCTIQGFNPTDYRDVSSEYGAS